MELSKRIQELIDYSGLSIPKFAERVGFKTPQGIRELIKGNTMTLSRQAQYNIGNDILVGYKADLLKGQSAGLLAVGWIKIGLIARQPTR